ncbi:hypothetical protein DPMN_059660 [Dreissena polymorpha]|uniref:Uncharacterized protein n=1 Tax=Dreissena polymorpha TaxID=45954 RepID=A0A9D4C4E4_DREPO|nr:hypothetical protein DPMN_059660 [Dreissena polymorpha]
MLTMRVRPHQNEAIGPNCACSCTRNWWRLPALDMSPWLPSLRKTMMQVSFALVHL